MREKDTGVPYKFTGSSFSTCRLVCFSYNSLILFWWNYYSSHHLFSREGRLGTTDDFATSFLHFFLILHCPLGLGELQACPFLDVVFQPLLSALSSSPFHCALQDSFGQTWYMGDMTIPLRFASLCNGQEVFRNQYGFKQTNKKVKL